MDTCKYHKITKIDKITKVVENWGLKGPALFFVCLLYQLLNDAQKDTKKF